METTRYKMPWWKKILYTLLLLVFFIIGAGIWEWGVSLIISIIISIISITMISFFWGELRGQKENDEVKKQKDIVK